MPRVELDQLSEHLTRFAQQLLDAGTGLRPLGATIDTQGHLQYCAADDDSESPDFRAQIEALKGHLRQVAESGQIHAAGLCFDVIIHRGDHKLEAIQCILEHADGEAVERFTPYSKTSSGVIVLGE